PGTRTGGVLPRRPTADDHDIQCAVLDETRIAVGRLPPFEQMFLEADGVRNGVHRESMLVRSLGSEEVDLGTEPEDEIVVRDRRQLLEADLLRVEDDSIDARHVNRRVLLVPDEVPEGGPDPRVT